MPEKIAVRPSLRSLGALAGVTSMTVSLALRDHPSISASTRTRLKKLAAEHGYRPDPTVTKLMHHLRARRGQRTQSTLCGLRMRPEPLSPQGYDYGQQVVEGAKRRAESLGFRFEEMFIDEPGLTPARLQRILASRAVEGVVLLPMVRPVDLAKLLDWSVLSAVAATSSVLGPRLHTVIPDHFGNMMRLCERLTEQGLRRVGLATHAEHNVRVEHRMAAAQGWHHVLHARTPVPPLSINRRALDGAAVCAWIEAHGLEAVMSDSEFDLDLIAAELPVRKRSRPTLVSTSLHPPFARYAGINEKAEEIGAASIEALAAMIQRGERGLPVSPRTTSIPGEFFSPRRT
jgi:hypothetical protein